MAQFLQYSKVSLRNSPEKLTRKLSQSIMVGEIEVTVVEVHGDSIRLGIAAPRGVVMDRLEVWE